MTSSVPSAEWTRLVGGTVGHWTWRVGSTDLTWDDSQRSLLGAGREESPAHCWSRVLIAGEVMRTTAVESLWREISVYRIRTGSGHIRWIMDRVTDTWEDADGSLWLRGISLDVTSWQQDEVAGAVGGDELASLASEATLLEFGEQYLATDPTAHCVLLAVNLDAFSLVNDAFGRSVGDDLLREVASRLTGITDADTMVGHVGGDEFLVLVRGADMARGSEVADRVTGILRQPASIGGRQMRLSASVGLSSTDVPGTDEDGSERAMTALRQDVDLAVHEAKRQGGDRWLVCEPDLRRQTAHALRLQADLQEALRSTEQLALHYQPAFSLRSGHPVGVEGLLRWTHPVRGRVPPLDIVGGAERSGLIVPLGDWVLATAVEQAARWKHLPDFTTWFNVSPRQLVDDDFPERLRDALQRVDVAPHRVGVEVTESVLSDDSPGLALVRRIRDLGVKIAIDDFGTGYSSLSRLLHMPVDLVKIDRSFVEASDTVPGRAVLESIIRLAHGLESVVIAEGVETPAQLGVLRDLGCDEVAGYLFSPPRPSPEVPLARLRFTDYLVRAQTPVESVVPRARGRRSSPSPSPSPIR